jgi:hypothetical protein
MRLSAQALFLVLAALAGCATPSSTLRGLAQDQHDDVVMPLRNSSDALALAQRSMIRADKVLKLIQENKVETAADHYHAALVLAQCTRENDLATAHEQGLAAAQMGEKRGFRVAAEAIDKLMVKRGMLQRYGTQFVWEPVLHSWRLYPLDPRTTDAERTAMGVPTLEGLKRQEAELNKHAASGAPGQ